MTSRIPGRYRTMLSWTEMASSPMAWNVEVLSRVVFSDPNRKLIVSSRYLDPNIDKMQTISNKVRNTFYLLKDFLKSHKKVLIVHYIVYKFRAIGHSRLNSSLTVGRIHVV